jgi:methionine-S-sulfoxide reductase
MKLSKETKMKTIYLAGGCFWGVEAYFKLVEGVLSTEVGYIDGPGETTYEAVCSGSGHAEAVKIEYEESSLSLKTLFEHFFNIIDPTSLNKQGPDRGIQYRSGIYTTSQDQYVTAKNMLLELQKSYKNPIVVELKEVNNFILAEDYHQDYLEKRPFGYCHIDLESVKNVK